MIGEQQVKLAAKMYEMRDTSRRLLGERYAETMAAYRGHIQAAMAKRSCDELGAAKHLLECLQRDVPDSGSSQMFVVAAMVEMVEGAKPASPRDRLLRRRAGKAGSDGR